jgi:S-adenosylmethionine synthetase
LVPDPQIVEAEVVSEVVRRKTVCDVEREIPDSPIFGKELQVIVVADKVAIGVAKPLSVYVETHGTSVVAEDRMVKVLCDLVDLSPRGIREHLGLNRPIYARTAAYGHFGRPVDADGGFSWERLDLVDRLRAALN